MYRVPERETRGKDYSVEGELGRGPMNKVPADLFASVTADTDGRHLGRNNR